jgi:hypothetical protein
MITQAYCGEIGNLIIIIAKDDFKVKDVTITIYNASNELIERGAAVANRDGLSWQYACTRQNTNIAGSTIIAVATDLPGNEGVMEVGI